ncbi:MAG: hypothetical protein WCS25_06600, partial [Victivallaceae bacterium]
MNLKILTLMVSALFLLFGCESIGRKKIPCNDIEVFTRFRREISILQDKSLYPDSERKFRAARVLYQNVDFSFARDTELLVRIFGTGDVKRAKVLDNDSLVFLYSWENEYIRFAFMGV